MRECDLHLFSSMDSSCFSFFIKWILFFAQWLYLLTAAISRKVVGKNVHVTTPKGNMGYDLHLLLSFSICKHTSMAFRAILSYFFKEQWTQNHPQYLSGLSGALFLTTFLKIAVCCKLLSANTIYCIELLLTTSWRQSMTKQITKWTVMPWSLWDSLVMKPRQSGK